MVTREKIKQHIEQNPGAYFRKLLRDLGLASGQLQHHLHRLVRSGDITPYSCLGHTCYCSSSTPASSRAIHAAVKNPVNRDILLHLLSHETTHCHDLGSHLNRAASTITHRLKRLEQEGIIHVTKHGKHKCVHFKNADDVRKVLSS